MRTGAVLPNVVLSNTPLVAVTVAGAALAGVAVAQGSTDLLGLAVGSVAALLLLVYWRLTLYVFVGYLTIAGFVSALLYPWAGARLIPHALAALVCAGFLAESLVTRRSIAPRQPVIAAAGGVAALWLIQTMNPAQVSSEVAALGVITYVVFVPIILVGYRVLSDPVHVRRLALFMTATAFPVAAVGTWQFLGGKEAYASLGPGFRPFGIGDEGVDVFRFPATFAFASQFGEYLLIELLLTAGAVVALRGRARWVAGVAFAWCCILVGINGARTLYLVPPVSLACLGLLLSRGRPRTHDAPAPSRARFSVARAKSASGAGGSAVLPFLGVLALAVTGIAVAIWLAGPLLTVRFASLDPTNVDNLPDLRVRVFKTFDQIGMQVASGGTWWAGHGSGTASPYLWHLGVQRPVEESFFSEVLYQLGVLGPLAYLAMFGVILAQGVRAMRASSTRGGDSWIWSRVYFVAVAQVMGMTTLTGDEALVFFPSNVLFWLLLGGLLAQGWPERVPAAGAPGGARTTPTPTPIPDITAVATADDAPRLSIAKRRHLTRVGAGTGSRERAIGWERL